MERFWGGDFSTGEMGKFQLALTAAQEDSTRRSRDKKTTSLPLASPSEVLGKLSLAGLRTRRSFY